MNRFPQKTIYGRVLKTIKENNLIKKGDKVVVALSGGPDSVALLHVLLQLRLELGFDIFICHYNHRLRGQESERDEQFVKKLSKKNNLECIIGRADRHGMFKSEDEARKARYLFFEKILKEGRGDSVALAHQLNDQAETVLMRLVRGAGIRGLKSIPYKRQKFIRPLLDIPRKEIEKFLEEEKLPYIIDQTNTSLEYLRNEIRINLIPYLSKLNKNILEVLANVSKNVSLDYDFIQKSALDELKKTADRISDTEIELDLKKWLSLHPSLQLMILRTALSSLHSLDDITVKHLNEVVTMLKKGVGKKYKRLPHSLIIELQGGKIILRKLIP